MLCEVLLPFLIHCNSFKHTNFLTHIQSPLIGIFKPNFRDKFLNFGGE